jgi:hypothetical protein
MANTTTDVSGAIALLQLSVSTDGGSVYNPILGLRSLGFPETTQEMYDVTDTDVTDGFLKFVTGWKEKGEGAIEVNYTQATYVQLKALSGILDWRLEYTDEAQTSTDPKFEFQAGISAGPTLVPPTKDAWTITMSVKGSGDDTFTAGT